jgi:hypothetical protein
MLRLCCWQIVLIYRRQEQVRPVAMVSFHWIIPFAHLSLSSSGFFTYTAINGKLGRKFTEDRASRQFIA